MFKHLDYVQTLPNDISHEEYAAVRKSWHTKDGKYPDWYIGAVGFLASYNAKFFGGRAGQGYDHGKLRNYYDESKRNLLAQIPHLQDIEFDESDYRQLNMSNYRGGVIYCDIPYQSTTGYQNHFVHNEFWAWATQQSKENIVLVSEQTAPSNWKSIWSKPIKRTLNAVNKFQVIENLYILT